MAFAHRLSAPSLQKLSSCSSKELKTLKHQKDALFWLVIKVSYPQRWGLQAALWGGVYVGGWGQQDGRRACIYTHSHTHMCMGTNAKLRHQLIQPDDSFSAHSLAVQGSEIGHMQLVFPLRYFLTNIFGGLSFFFLCPRSNPKCP